MAGVGSGGVTAPQVWTALVNAGASPVQAAAIMGNALFESSLNPESAARDSNGYMAYGLVSWNAASYPSASSLVTGSPAADLKAQVKFLAQTGGFADASGATVQQAASNFASRYERCQGCQAGGSENQRRVAAAVDYLGAAKSGKWPSPTASPGGGEQSTPADCFLAFPNADPLSSVPVIGKVFPSTGFCILSKSQARSIAGVSLILLGGGILAFGTVLLFALALKHSGAGRAAGGTLEKAGAGVTLVAPEAGIPLAAAGAAVRGGSRRKTAAKQGS